MVEHFYFNDGVFKYGFSETHPLKPERLYRMFALLEHYVGDCRIQSSPASREDLLRVHDEEYLDAVKAIDTAAQEGRLDEVRDLRTTYGFWGDNPAFAGMYGAAAAYTGASADAARAVVNGAQLAYGIGGGLHHALADRASGFCIFNDCAVACSILRERFGRVAYVDIDVHHGDGVQWLFFDDPTVLTCSIHEDGATLWPGTGRVSEIGAEYSSLNVPVEAGTTRDVWLSTFRATILAALERWKPEAIVLQMGTDTHYLDPLAHIDSDQSAWLAAILDVEGLGVPMVALGGGGYNLTTVPRMWTSAVLSLAGVSFADEIPEGLQRRLEARAFSDFDYPCGSGGGNRYAVKVVEHFRREFLPNLALN